MLYVNFISIQYLKINLKENHFLKTKEMSGIYWVFMLTIHQILCEIPFMTF